MTVDWKRQAQQLQSDFTENLKSFLSINSIEDMDSASEGKPFGEGVAEALQFMLDQGASDGFTTKNLEGYAGYIEYGSGIEEVGVLVHVDVVPVGDGWETPPFAPDIRNGRIYARGAIDDKGPALAAFYALKIVRDTGLPLSKRVRLIVGTDEESGWLCMKRYAELETLPEIGFSPDADFPIVHAEKGQINPVLVLSNRQNAIGEFSHSGTGLADQSNGWILRSFSAGDRVNMVPEQASATIFYQGSTQEIDQLKAVEDEFSRYLSTQKVNGRVSNENGELTFHLEGKAAHGMEPHEGVNAGLLLAHFLHGYPFHGQGKAFLQLLSDILYEDFFGEKLGLACEDDVTGKLTVNAGVLTYDESTGPEVKLNIRYPATVSVDNRVEVLKGRVTMLGWEIAALRTSKAHYVPQDHPAIKTLQRVYEEQTGQEATLLSTGGATYARSMQSGVAFGAVFPGKEMTAHQRNEYAEIDDLVKAIAIYAQAIYELAK